MIDVTVLETALEVRNYISISFHRVFIFLIEGFFSISLLKKLNLKSFSVYFVQPKCLESEINLVMLRYLSSIITKYKKQFTAHGTQRCLSVAVNRSHFMLTNTTIIRRFERRFARSKSTDQCVSMFHVDRMPDVMIDIFSREAIYSSISSHYLSLFLSKSLIFGSLL